MKKNKLFIVSGLMLALVIGYLIYNQNRIAQENQDLRRMQMINQNKGKDGKVNDPYISGPVKNRIIKGYGEIKECYTAYLATKPEKKEGKVTIDWQINKNGRAETVQVVSNEFEDEAIGKCMISKISKWQFPEPLVRTYKSHVFAFKDVLSEKK